MRLIGLLFSTALIGCTNDSKLLDGINLFTVQEDIELGQQLHEEILSQPDQYPILDPEEYPEAYGHMYRIRDEILNSGVVEHKDDFEWQIHIIDDDTQNAFCAPGGYIYVYTGLINFLDHEDELAGVLAHEIAHADERHSTEQMTKSHGLSAMLDLVFDGDPDLVSQIATGLLSLSFSRADEAESDQHSVEYLCHTEYAAHGAAGFFEKLEGAAEMPAFLSTHPSSETRVEDIRTWAQENACNVELNSERDYQEVKDSLLK